MKRSRTRSFIRIMGYLLCVYLFFEITLRIALFAYVPVIGGPSADLLRVTWVKRRIVNWWRHPQQLDKLGVLTFDVFDPTLGWDVKPNVHFAAIGDPPYTLTTNSRGIRALQEYSLDRVPGLRRIVTIGDSFTFGEENDDDKIFPYYLQQVLPKTEVINLGVHAYGHDQMLLKLKMQGLKYSPDLVLLFLIHDDLHRNLLAFRDFAKPKFKIVSGKLELTGVPVPTPAEVLRSELYRSYLFATLSILVDTFTYRGDDIRADEITLAHAIFEEMQRECERADAVFALAGFRGDRELIRQLAPAGGKTVLVDVDPWREPAAFRNHWRAAGHKLVAEGIARSLHEQGLW